MAEYPVVNGKDRVRNPVPPKDFRFFEILGNPKLIFKKTAVLEPLSRLGGIKDRSSRGG